MIDIASAVAGGAAAGQSDRAVLFHDADECSAAFSAAFERAAGVHGVIDRVFMLAGEPVRFRFAGPALEFLAEAFAHVEVAREVEPVLTVYFWDAASTGAAAPEPPVEGRIGEAAGLRILWQQPPVRVVIQPAQGTVNAFDERGNAWFWCERPDALPFWEAPAPIRMIMHWWLGTRGKLLLHAAAVGRDAGGTLVVGVGGSGKSTTSLLALRHGLRFASDDYVAVDPAADRPGGQPYVHSLYASAKLTPEQIGNFPEFTAGIGNPDRAPEDKAVVFLRRVAPSAVSAGFPLRAVLVPRIVARRDTSTRPISPIAALTGLAPSTIFQLPGTASADLAGMTAVVRSVPTFLLELGNDFADVPAAIERLLDQLGVPT